VRVFLCSGIEARFGYPLEPVAENFRAYFFFKKSLLSVFFFFILIGTNWALKWLGWISFNDFIFFLKYFASKEDKMQ
jgi:hypothetical protein